MKLIDCSLMKPIQINRVYLAAQKWLQRFVGYEVIWLKGTSRLYHDENGLASCSFLFFKRFDLETIRPTLLFHIAFSIISMRSESSGVDWSLQFHHQMLLIFLTSCFLQSSNMVGASEVTAVQNLLMQFQNVLSTANPHYSFSTERYDRRISVNICINKKICPAGSWTTGLSSIQQWPL